MPLYDFRCDKCKKDYERFCSYGNTGKQKCEVCGKLLKRIYSPSAIRGFPIGWSTFNNPDIAKPQNEIQRKRYKDFMEQSQPISSSTT